MEKFDFRGHADDLASKLVQEMQRDYHLHCIGSGGAMSRDLENIELYFIANRKGTIEEARRIEIMSIQRLTESINKDVKLLPYLRKFPFRGVAISLSFRQPDNKYYSDKSLARVSHVKGILYYETIDPKTDKYILLHKETFEEALKIVQSENGKTTNVK